MEENAQANVQYILRTPQIEKPTPYTGDKETYPFDRWVKNFMRFANKSEWNLEKTQRNISSHLTGTLRDQFEEIEMGFANVVDALEGIRNLCGVKAKSKVRYTIELSAVRQKPDESVFEYQARLRLAAGRVEENPHEKDLGERFMVGVLPEYCEKMVVCKGLPVMEILQLARKYETLYKEQGRLPELAKKQKVPLPVPPSAAKKTGSVNFVVDDGGEPPMVGFVDPR